MLGNIYSDYISRHQIHCINHLSKQIMKHSQIHFRHSIEILSIEWIKFIQIYQIHMNVYISHIIQDIIDLIKYISNHINRNCDLTNKLMLTSTYPITIYQWISYWQILIQNKNIWIHSSTLSSIEEGIAPRSGAAATPRGWYIYNRKR